jgi:hypothetical protein
MQPSHAADLETLLDGGWPETHLRIGMTKELNIKFRRFN